MTEIPNYAEKIAAIREANQNTPDKGQAEIQALMDMVQAGAKAKEAEYRIALAEEVEIDSGNSQKTKQMEYDK